MAPRRARRGSGSNNPSRQDLAENRRHDRAWLAVKAFNEMRPMLTSFARAVTGDNSVNVRAGKITQTNGRDIFIVPPISLGDRPQHERELCGKRDSETRIMLCHACAASDLLDRRLFHEIAHIAFKSFAKVTKFHRQRMHALADEWHPKDACNHAPSLHRQLDAEQGYGGLAYVFSPFLNQLNEAFDDARVDSKMYRTRPGLKQPTLAAMHSIFQRGIEKDDGTLLKWADAKLNGQIIIGLMLVGMGIEIKPGWLSDEAIEHLKDPELLRISDRAHLANSVINSFDIALAAFLRLQEMGLCYVPKCVPTPSLNAEPEPNEDKEKDDDSDGCNSGGTGDGNADPSDSPEPKDDKSEAGDKTDVADDREAQQDGGQGEDDPGDPSEGDDSGDAGGGRSEQDDGSPGDSDDEDADGGSGGDDPEAGTGDDQPDDGEVRDADGGSKPEDKSDGQDADDPAGGHSDGDGSDSPEPEAGDEAGEPGGTGEGDREDSDGEDDAKQDREGNDGAGESDHDGSDREPGEEPEGPGAGGGSPAADDGADAPAEAGEEVAEADEPAGDGADRGDDDIESADDGLEQAEDLEGDDGAEARRPLGEDVWGEDNPESQVEPGLTPEERQALMGTPEEISDLLGKFLGHGHEEEIDAELLGDPPPEEMTDERDQKAVATAVGQEAVFDTSSKTVRGVQVVQHPQPSFGWQTDQSAYGNKPADFMPAESIIGQNLMQARIVFSENKRAKTQGNLKSGKINTRVLGRRAALGDERLFKKRTLPGKRDYFVVITADCSGSTSSSRRNERIKRAVFAKAELLNRLGIPFAIYGHTGGEGDINVGWWSEHPEQDDMTEVWLMQIKGANEPWNDTTRQRLADMPPVAENLDGHTLEYMRKVAQKSTATDRIIIYYTDGAMPAANYDEELVILESEIEKCRRENITLMAVGINTDSPERYGFDTVRVDSDEDLSAVVDRLKTRLTS